VGIVDRTAHCNSNFRLGDADAVILSEPGDGQIIVRPVSIKCRQVIWGDFFVPVRLTVRYVLKGSSGSPFLVGVIVTNQKREKTICLRRFFNLKMKSFDQ
jgi:hypothetical protein